MSIQAATIAKDFESAIPGCPYKLGASNPPKECDCSGAFVWAFKTYGMSIKHSSNAIPRQDCVEIGKINSVFDLRVGDAVFKCRDWHEQDKTNRWYGMTPGDFYHIGLVTSVNPMRIVHSTGPVGKVDTTLGNWNWRGSLKNVIYSMAQDGGDISMSTQTGTAIAEKGTTVNMRKAPDAKAALVARVPVGDAVTVHEQAQGWARVSYLSYRGYMQAQFLALEEAPTYTVSLLDATEAERAAIQAACGRVTVERNVG